MKSLFVTFLSKKLKFILNILVFIEYLILPTTICLGQETLQTVTAAGSITDQRINIHNAVEQDIIGTPSNSSNTSYLSQYAYTTVNGLTQYWEDYMPLRTEGAYWYNDANGYGFYNRGYYAEPVMEVISGAYGGFGGALPSHCAVRNNFIYQFIAGTIEYPGTTDKLITDSTSEVLYGITSSRKFYAGKGIFIGTTANDPNSMLQVNGNITAKKLTVTQSGWLDFVFGPSYHLPSLSSTEAYIEEKGHLPDIPSVEEIEKKI